MSRFFALFVLTAGMGFSSPSFADPGEAAAASDVVAGDVAAEADDAAASDAAEPAAEAPAGGEGEAAAADADKEDVAESLDDAAEQVSLLLKAVQDKNWSLAVGFLMMLLVFVANKFGLKDKIGSKAVPWVVMALSVSAVCGAALATGVAVSEALVQGVLAGVAAIGGWELLFKHLLTKKAA